MTKKGGMTGTALTEEKEFRDIYGMDVVEIPTNRPVQRKDLEDAVYMTKKEKFNAVVEAVKEAHAKQAAGSGRYDHNRDFRTPQQNASPRRYPAQCTECEVP